MKGYKLIAVVWAVLAVAVQAETQTWTLSNAFGNVVTATLTDDGTLTISRSGQPNVNVIASVIPAVNAIFGSCFLIVILLVERLNDWLSFFINIQIFYNEFSGGGREW